MTGKVDIPELIPLLEKAGIEEVDYFHLHKGIRESAGTFPLPVTLCNLRKGLKGAVAYGYAYLSPRDQFCRRTGRIVSLRRAIHNLDLKNRRNDNGRDNRNDS